MIVGAPSVLELEGRIDHLLDVHGWGDLRNTPRRERTPWVVGGTSLLHAMLPFIGRKVRLLVEAETGEYDSVATIGCARTAGTDYRPRLYWRTRAGEEGLYEAWDRLAGQAAYVRAELDEDDGGNTWVGDITLHKPTERFGNGDIEHEGRLISHLLPNRLMEAGWLVHGDRDYVHCINSSALRLMGTMAFGWMGEPTVAVPDAILCVRERHVMPWER